MVFCVNLGSVYSLNQRQIYDYKFVRFLANDVYEEKMQFA